MHIGMFIFPNMTQLDFSAPYEVFNKWPGSQLHIIGASLLPVTAEGGLRLLPDTTFITAPALDVLFVPGGPGIGPLLNDMATLHFLREQAQHARYVTSVCTGSLLLGAAGLLKGYAATTHWLSMDLLPFFQAIPTAARVVIDRNRVTGAGITSGIDFALRLISLVVDEATAQKIQLLLEYDPQPPFQSGHPRLADADLVASLTKERAQLQLERKLQAKKAAQFFCT